MAYRTAKQKAVNLTALEKTSQTQNSRHTPKTPAHALKAQQGSSECAECAMKIYDGEDHTRFGNTVHINVYENQNLENAAGW